MNSSKEAELKKEQSDTPNGVTPNGATPNADEKQRSVKKTQGSFFQLMDSGDKFYWRLGAFFAMCGGARFPITSVFLGDLFDKLGRPGATSFEEQVLPHVYILLVCGVVAGALRAAGDVCVAILQHRMVSKFQHQYLETLLQKDSKWYDQRGAATLLASMTTSVFQVSDLYGPELSTCIMGVSAFILSTIIAVTRSWQLGLIMVASLPFMIIATMFGFQSFMKMQNLFGQLSGAAALHLDQAIRGIATVQSYALEQRVASNIEPWVRMCSKACIPLARRGSMFFATRMFCEWSVAALMFFVGSRFVISRAHNPMTGTTWEPGDIFAVWFIQYMGISQLQLSLGYAQSFGEGKGALLGLKSLQTEDVSTIEASSRQLAQLLNRADVSFSLKDIELIEFDKVSFRYPSRPDRLVLDTVSFEVRKGQKLALVGESGSGKSTVVQLLERFYDVESGQIRINGQDVQNIPLSTLRRCMALVEQEPVLFATSLRKNLEYATSTSVSEEKLNDVMTSCCMDFVNNLPTGANTYVGASGGTLSGGQKQRTCIARALLRNPKLLLLDEATAALDNRTEKDVQETLDKVVANAGTSITIAHRLSTIKTSDNVLVFKDGRIVEQGSHDELMELGSEGLYFGLVKLQEVANSGEVADGLPVASETAPHSGEDEKVSVGRKTVVASSKLTKQDDAPLDLSRITPRRLGVVLPKMCLAYWERPAIGLALMIGWVGHAGMSMTQPVFAVILISMMTGLYAEGDELEENANWSTLQLVCLAIMQFLFVNGRIYVISAARNWQMARNRSAVAMNLMHQDISFFDNPECTSAKIMITFTSLIIQAEMLSTNLIPEVGGALLTVALTFTIAISKQAKIALVVAAVWPVNMIAKYLEFRDMLAKFRRGKSANAETASAQVFHDCIVHMKTVRATQCEDKMMEEFLELVQQEGFTNRRGRLQTGLIKGTAYALELGLFAFAFWWSAKVMDEGASFADCTQAMMCIILGLMPVTSVLNAFDSMERKVDSAARLLDLKFHKPKVHTSTPSIAHTMTAIEPLEVVGSILSFDAVHFKYAQRPDVEVLKSISFKVQLGSGNMVGLCGPSGGGKSTVLALISRFYDPIAGSISIEGLGDIRDLDVQRWRRNIGVVQQEPMLFQDSLLNNVRYGNPNSTPTEVKQAAKMAHLDFASGEPQFDPTAPMPHPRILMGGDLKALNMTQQQFEKLTRAVQSKTDGKLDSTTSESSSHEASETTASDTSGRVSWDDTVRNTNLSGGQKQRIAIARAFLRNPTILIFDEATSALDSYSEKVVQDSLAAYRATQTQFLIAHRLSTISEADLILVVSMGVIAETGTSEELLQKGGLYYNLAHGKH